MSKIHQVYEGGLYQNYRYHQKMLFVEETAGKSKIFQLKIQAKDNQKIVEKVAVFNHNCRILALQRDHETTFPPH